MATTAADLMLRDPKTLPATASVADVRAVLSNPRVQMVLLTEGRAFRGAITSLPHDADPDAPALDFADLGPERLAPDEPAETAYERARATPSRRVLVIGEDETLLGLLCLNAAGTGFCGAPAPAEG